MLIPGESPGGEIIVTNQREFAPFLGEPPDNVFADQLAAFGDKDDLAAPFVELTLLHHGDKTALGKNDEYVGAIGALHESPGSIVFNVWPAAGLLPGSERQQLAQPGHLNEADLHNFTDLVPPVAFAVLGAFIEFTDVEARKHPAGGRAR